MSDGLDLRPWVCNIPPYYLKIERGLKNEKGLITVNVVTIMTARIPHTPVMKKAGLFVISNIASIMIKLPSTCRTMSHTDGSLGGHRSTVVTIFRHA